MISLDQTLAVNTPPLDIQIDQESSWCEIYNAHLNVDIAKQISEILNQTPVFCLKICSSNVEEKFFDTLFNSASSHSLTRFVFCHNEYSSTMASNEFVRAINNHKTLLHLSFQQNKIMGTSHYIDINHIIQPTSEQRQTQFWNDVCDSLKIAQLNKKCVNIISEYSYDLKDSLYQNLIYTAKAAANFPSFDKEYLEKIAQDKLSLTKLKAHEKDINDFDILALTKALLTNRTITRLEFYENHISDQGVVSLILLLSKNKNITELDLRENQIRDSGAIALRESLEKVNNTLTTLSIRNNPISNSEYTRLTQALINHTKTADFICKSLFEHEDTRPQPPLSISPADFMHALLHDPNSLLDIPSNYPARTTLLYIREPMFDLIAECQCSIASSRGTELDYRKEIENLVIDQCRKLNKNFLVSIVSVGSADLFQELILIVKLKQAGFNNIHISLIDLKYDNTEMLVRGESTRSILLYQFINLLHTLGIDVIDGSTVDPKKSYEPLLMQKWGFERFRQLLSVSNTSDKATSEKTKVILNLFSSIESYIQNLQNGFVQPQSVLMIDLDKPFQQETTIQPLLNAVQNGTTYFTTYLSFFKRHDRDSVRLEGYQKANDQWVPLFDKNKYTVSVQPHDPFKLLLENPKTGSNNNGMNYI